MPITQQQQTWLKYIKQTLDPFLEEGYDYYIDQLNKGWRNDKGALVKVSGEKIEFIYELDNGKIKIKQILYKNKGFYGITSSLPVYTKIRYSFKKGEAIQAKVYDGTMLIKFFHENYKSSFHRNNSPYRKWEENIEFIRGKELSLEFHLKHFKKKGKTEEFHRDSHSLKEELKCLDVIQGGTLKKIKIIYTKDSFSISSFPGMPEIGIAEITDKIDTSHFDSKDDNMVFEYMESRESIKIQTVFNAFESDAQLREKVEERYLNFIKARLGEKAGIEQFSEAAPRLSQIEELFEFGNLKKDFIGFSLLEDECRFQVDILGSITKNAIDIEVFKAIALQCKNEREIQRNYESFAKKIRSYLKKQSKIHPKGWFAKLCKTIHTLHSDRLFFERSSLNKANASPVMEEFMFMTALNSKHGYSLHISQSDTPNLTSVFWMLPEVPDTTWFESKIAYPKNPINFRR